VRVAVLLLACGCSFDHAVAVRDGSIDGDGSGSDVGDGSGSDVIDPSLREKIITIGAGFAGTHSSFPLWVQLTDSDIAGRARADGTDIHFVAGTTPLDYEIQGWSKNSGELAAWVRLPALAAGTTLAVRYGDVAAAHAPSSMTTFTGYNAVWHFEDALNNATIVDARGTTNGTGVNLGPSDSVAGKLGNAIDFNDDTEEVTFTNPLTGSSPHTISAWVNQGVTSSNDALIALGPGGVTSQARWLHTRFNGPELALGFYNNDWTTVNHDIIGDGWVLLHWVFEGSNRMSRMYVNGTLVAGPFQHNSGINTTGTAGVIGNAPDPYGTTMGINAVVDEVRIINVARSADWITAEALNQAMPATFYTVGPEQTP
jgi:MSHA biogenesis protein MshQ